MSFTTMKETTDSDKIELEMSTTSSPTAAGDMLELAAHRLSISSAKSSSYSNSIASIYSSTNTLVQTCLGPGCSLQIFLNLSILIDAVVHIVIALAMASVTLMFFGEVETNATPKQICASLFIVVLSLVTAILSKHFMMQHAGSYFMRRAKFAINTHNSKSSQTAAEHSEIMGHLSRVCTIFLTDKVVFLSGLVTEIISLIFIVICSNILVGAVAFLLLVGVKYLSSCDDYLLIQQQHKKMAIIEKLEKSSSSGDSTHIERADLRFFHEATSPGHVLIKMAHVTGSFVAPVLFFYFVISCGALPNANPSYLSISSMTTSTILFCLVSSLQISSHGRIIHLISNIFHCEKLLDYDREHKVFEALEGANMGMAKEQLAKESRLTAGSAFNPAEKTALYIGTLAFTGIIAFFLWIGTTTNLAYKPVEIICSHVPDDGVHVSFEAERSLSVFSGSVLKVSGEEILDTCVGLFSDALEVNGDEAVDYDLLEEDFELGGTDDGETPGDVSAELDATTALQMEADANPILQADGGKRVIIAATYRSWKEEGVNRLERDFVIDETGADELGEEGDLHDKDTDGRRRLSESALSATASGATFSSSSITSFSRPYTYTLEAQVGTGRYDGTRNEVTVKLFGSGGKESNFLNLGQGLKKGEKRIVEVADTFDISNIEKIVLTTNGKDGLLFSSIKIDRPTIGKSKGSSLATMKGSLRCNGSKRKKTWSCSQELSVTHLADGEEEEEEEEETSKGCRFEECKYPSSLAAISHTSISDFANAASHRDPLTYPFGTVWKDCQRNGPSRFTHTAICDAGCANRHGSFKLSPKEVFGDDEKAGKGANEVGGGAGCQQKNGKAYPKYCLEPLVDGAPWSMSHLSSKEQKLQCTKSVAHDRGHQVPANNWDGDKATCAATNYMTNILPQAAQMNRGAWLRTEMLTECWRQEQPLTIIGGAVYKTGSLAVPEWEGIDRSDWFMESHYVKNPAYFWKVVVARETDNEWGGSIAFWMPNHESASNKKIDDFIVPISKLETLLSTWGEEEVFDEDVVGDKNYWPLIWPDPKGCWRG